MTPSYGGVGCQSNCTTFQNWNPIGDIGGPILRDRLWYYLGTSYNRVNGQETATFKNSPKPYFTDTFHTSNDDAFYNWNVSTQLTKGIRVRFTGNNQRSKSRGAAPALQPNGSTFADGTPTDGFTNAAFPTTNGAFDPQKYADTVHEHGQQYDQRPVLGEPGLGPHVAFLRECPIGLFQYNTVHSRVVCREPDHSLVRREQHRSCGCPVEPAEPERVRGCEQELEPHRRRSVHARVRQPQYHALQEHEGGAPVQVRYAVRARRQLRGFRQSTADHHAVLEPGRLHPHGPDRPWPVRLLHGQPQCRDARERALEQLGLLGAGQLDGGQEADDQRGRAHRRRARAVVPRRWIRGSTSASPTRSRRGSASPTTSRATAHGRRTAASASSSTSRSWKCRAARSAPSTG